jgi:hypothetical protein
VKKIWVLILLISLGLNLGLGMRLIRIQGQVPCGPDSIALGEVPGPDGVPAKNDTISWRKLAGKRLDRLAAHLNLTPQQKEIFAQTRAEVGSRMMVRRSEMQEARNELLELVILESTPPETLRRSFLDLAARQAEIDSVISEVLLQELEILDPDQRVQYLKMLPMNQRGHAGMHNRGRGRRGAN